MAEPLNAVLQRIPEHSEPATLSPAEVSAHANLPAPGAAPPGQAGHGACCLERTAVVADRRDVRWLEPHAAVLVDCGRLRWRPIKLQQAIDT